MSSGSGVSKDAFNGYGINMGEQNAAYGTVNPIYTQEATNPQGLTPAQIASMTTASTQTLGGGVSAATGLAGLQAARSGNAGGYATALDNATRSAGVQHSQDVLGIQNQSALLARQQQQQGLAGLSGIYDTSGRDALGDLNAANSSKTPFWQTWLLNGEKAAGQAAAAGG